MINEEGRRAEWRMVTEDNINWSKERWKGGIYIYIYKGGERDWRNGDKIYAQSRHCCCIEGSKNQKGNIPLTVIEETKLYLEIK